MCVVNVEDPPKLPAKLNEFDSSFDRQNTASVAVYFPVAHSPLPRPFTALEAEVRKQDSKTATGPDGVSTAKFLKHCL